MRKNLLALFALCCTSLTQAGICTREYAPVCGQLLPDQQTFANRCLMKDAGASWVSDGNAQPHTAPRQ